MRYLDSVFTVDGEHGRHFRLADHVLGHAGVGADVGRDEMMDLQGVVFVDVVPGEREGIKLRRNVQGCRRQRVTWTKRKKVYKKGDQAMTPTFLWGGRRHLFSSAQWELGRHGLHT